MKHCLRLSSLLILLLASCASPYKDLRPEPAAPSSALRFKPVFNKVLYRCTVNGRIVFKKFHLSGLLFFKTLEDGTTRAIFQNEMGFTFFDFEWDKADSFKVNKIIPQLDKPALIKTLHKDMDLLLMKALNLPSEKIFRRGGELFHRFELDKGIAYYIEKDDMLKRIENAGKTRVITIAMQGKTTNEAMPDSLLFTHHKANFTIELHKIEPDAAE